MDINGRRPATDHTSCIDLVTTDQRSYSSKTAGHRLKWVRVILQLLLTARPSVRPSPTTLRRRRVCSLQHARRR